ncbi:MAG: DUF1573 domain-containing protein [Methylococcales bacterium]
MKTGLKKRVRCFYLLFIIITLITFAGCSSGGGGNETDQTTGSGALSIEVRGNDWLIASGDETPSQIDGTEFGPTLETGSETHTFTLYNKTAAAISINSVELSGDASFTTDASEITLAPGDESDIKVVFTPIEANQKVNATVTLEITGGNYIFAMQGTTRAIWNNRKASKEDQQKWGRVQFDPETVVRSNAAEQDLKEIAEIAAGVWRDFVLMDTDTFSERVEPDLVRFSEQWGTWTVGLDNIIENIEFEWTSWDRPVAPIISNNLTIEDFELRVDGNGAIATYALDLTFGARWYGEERGRVFQAFSKSNGGWKLAVQHDTWGVTNLEEGTTGHSFDYVYPVIDMDRAKAFYGNFLGEPEISTSLRTTWRLGRPRFHLDTGKLAGFVKRRNGLPNGYAIIYTTDDISAERARLESLGVDIGTEVLTDWGPDPYFVAMDPVGNPFVWMQRVSQHDPAGDAPGLTIENPDNSIPADLFSEIESLFTDWAGADAESIGARMSADGVWWDTYSWVQGRRSDSVEASLKTMFEDGSHNRIFDTTPSGLDIDLVASSPNLRSVGAFTIVTLELDITGRGVHAFNEQASAVLSWQKDGQEWELIHVFIGIADISTDMALAIDYTGYPVDNLSAAKNFYTDTMLFGNPYSDSAWFGWWYEDIIGNHGVFGIFRTNQERDGMPRPGETSGYASFWVESAQEAFDILESLGADFPVIWAINSVSGIDYVPGYTQIYTVDSEGNGMLFSEYPGD